MPQAKTTVRRRYVPADTKRRAGQARSEVGRQYLLAMAMSRSEALVSELCGPDARRKGAVGRTLDIIWHINATRGLDATPIVREVLSADIESRIQLSPAEVARRFRTNLREEHPAEGQENLGTALLEAGEIDLPEWLEYARPELNLGLGLFATAEFMVTNGIDWRAEG